MKVEIQTVEVVTKTQQEVYVLTLTAEEAQKLRHLDTSYQVGHVPEDTSTYPVSELVAFIRRLDRELSEAGCTYNCAEDM